MHGEALRKVVLEADNSTSFAAQVADDWRSLDLPEKEQSMLAYVEKITLTATSITKDHLDGMRSVGWTDREILDIALVSAYYCFRCRMADSLGVELDDDRVDEELLEEIGRRRVTVIRQRTDPIPKWALRLSERPFLLNNQVLILLGDSRELLHASGVQCLANI